jgi:hypothetical protein
LPAGARHARATTIAAPTAPLARFLTDFPPPSPSCPAQEHECAQLLDIFDAGDLLYHIREAGGRIDPTALVTFCSGLQGLREMGFTETERMREALARSDGRHELAVQMLLEQPEGAR